MRTFPAIVLLAAALAAGPALATKVSNLDHVPHRIAYEVGGHAYERSIPPGQSVRFEGLPDGWLSLVSSPDPRHGGTVNADGILQGYIGNGRDQRIPASNMNEYVIWPGGNLQLQKRIKRFGLH